MRDRPRTPKAVLMSIAHRRAFLKAAARLTAAGVLQPAVRAALAPIVTALSACAADTSRHGTKAAAITGYSVTPVPFHEVSIQDQFWKPRLVTQARTLVPFALEKTHPAVDNLRKTAAYLRGDKSSLPFPDRYVASDLYKVMEGAAYILAANPDPELERGIDAIIDIIAAAQQPDGYLYEAHITGVSKNHPHWGPVGMGDRPYSWELHSHELYNMGHMYEAAIAYYQATGKDTWLKVSEKSARHIHRVFFEGDPRYNDGKPVNQAPGHQEIELALVKLYRVTGNRLYLDMAKRFLDIRGVTYKPNGDDPLLRPEYAQQHQPVAQQTEVVGHAVRAAYMYSAMADVDALSGTRDYQAALSSIWHSIVDTRMHITGGLGAMFGHEGFGGPYELPNKNTYNETCAAVANVLFNFRMFLATRDGEFMDVAEVALFNNALAGMNLTGNRFFYVNPLEADGHTQFNHGSAGRSAWFTTACCPTNLARLIPQVPGLMYSYDRDEIYATLYATSSTTVPLQSGNVRIEQSANYPFDGHVHMTLHPRVPQSFRLRLRIPTWARSARFVPGKLYDYGGGGQAQWTVQVNGTALPATVENGFAVLERRWLAGDTVTLTLAMPVRFSTAMEEVVADRGRVAVTRGPLVYCAEGVDNRDPIQDFYIEAVPTQTDVSTSTIAGGTLAGIVKIEFAARRTGIREPATLALIPYYAWNNRGDCSMIVWLPTQRATVETAGAGGASTAGITSGMRA